MSTLISDDEMVTLTGHKSLTKQRQVLSDHGVFFMTSKDGRPRTTWFHFNHPAHLRNAAGMADEPDFTQVKGA